MLNELPKPLFILEMANNHMGSLAHGIRTIAECAQALRGLPYRFAIKLQYRHLDTFLHPDYHHRFDLKYVKRFQETRLTDEEYGQLRAAIRDHGFLAACTPFDERSVDLVEEHEFDILKIASCSCTDWPLLERIVLAPMPAIASIGGVELDEVDKVLSFFSHRNRQLALMHCVAEYPTEANHLRLGQIDLLRKRYNGDVRIGFSTHEAPASLEPIQVAVAKGATIFEKHVGVPTDGHPLNDYSATPAEVRRWVDAAARALELCGPSETRDAGTERELSSLRALRRGVYAREPIPAGECLHPSRVFFAMPVLEGQLTANDFSKYAQIVADRPIPANGALTRENVTLTNNWERIYEIARAVRGLLQKSRVAVPRRADLEISHHYGIERFYETGLTMITVVNREYCKKLIVMLPGQSHPEQYHKIKEETFHVLYGEAVVKLGDREQVCRAGDLLVVERNVPHSFSTKDGVIIEEVSSSHIASDSYYADPAIMQNGNRKTVLTYWLNGVSY